MHAFRVGRDRRISGHRADDDDGAGALPGRFAIQSQGVTPMRTTLTWVIGKRGLLGSHLTRALAAQLPNADTWNGPGWTFTWQNRQALSDQLAGAVASFARAVRESYDNWIVLWAAGSGVVGTSREALE